MHSAAFEGQVVSFLAEGVFQKFPKLKLVLAESGFTWLPSLLWRTAKEWRGVRPEVPWIDRNPAELVAEHVRLTLQPVDAPKNDPASLARILDHIGSDRMLLFSTDYPHSVSLFPKSQDYIEQLTEGMEPDVRDQILAGNAVRVFNLA